MLQGIIQIENTISSVVYEKNYLTNSDSARFLGLTLDKNLHVSWKLHIDQLCSKLASACFILRTLSSLVTQQNMKVVYFSYFHSVTTYGVIFWGNSTDRNKVFTLQKRAIRLITNSSIRTSCRRLFKELGILPLQSQYILSLALFVVKNMEIFMSNSDTHTKNTRSKFDFFFTTDKINKMSKWCVLRWYKNF